MLINKILELTNRGYIIEFLSNEYNEELEVRLTWRDKTGVTYTRNRYINISKLKNYTVGFDDSRFMCSVLQDIVDDLERIYNAQICP